MTASGSRLRSCSATLVLLALGGCARPSAIPATRFANAPAAYAVNDRRDVPVAPAVSIVSRRLDGYDSVVHDPLMRALDVPGPRRAHGVNAIDEVPSSTWFTNRIGVRDLSPEEIRTGPIVHENPELHMPWTVVSTKVGGTALGFIIKDATGAKYVLKFDQLGVPEAETGTAIVTNRILWACGYNVPEDRIVHVRPEELVVAPDAWVKDWRGEKIHRLDRAEVLRRLAPLGRLADGRLRGLVSLWIEGQALGGFTEEGVRKDDPNDRIPHELRRDLRGAHAIFAWLDHTDLVVPNTLDTWVADPADPTRHYVRHYFIDLGKAMGGMSASVRDWRRSYVYEVDVGDTLWSLVALGTRDRPWQERFAPALPGVWSTFEARKFNPGTWKSDVPYRPLVEADRFDKFWGAKLIARFTRPQLRAAVEAAQFTDPRTVEYLVDTLVARQRATIAYWFARVNPLDRFTVTGARSALCFDDLAIRQGIASASRTNYRLTRYDVRGRALGPAVFVGATSTGRSCTGPLGPGPSDAEGYTVVRIDTVRPNFKGTTDVHVARSPGTGAPRVIGIWRR